MEFAYYDPEGGDYYLPGDDFGNNVAPVPEPGTLILLGSGLAVLLELRRRFKAKR